MHGFLALRSGGFYVSSMCSRTGEDLRHPCRVWLKARCCVRLDAASSSVCVAHMLVCLVQNRNCVCGIVIALQKAATALPANILHVRLAQLSQPCPSDCGRSHCVSTHACTFVHIPCCVLLVTLPCCATRWSRWRHRQAGPGFQSLTH